MYRNVTAAMVATSTIAASALAGSTSGPVEVELDQPSLDRWFYPFNGTPGSRASSPAFGALGLAGFDDRDAQFLVGFDTGSLVATGFEPNQYRVTEARLILTVAEGGIFDHDPTHDAVQTYYDPSDPEYVPDSDAGRPVEVFAVGYRGGYALETVEEGMPFGTAAIPPAELGRNVFAAVLDVPAGEFVDASRNVRQRFEVEPLGVGEVDGLPVGDTVPQDAEMSVELDVCSQASRMHLGAGLAFGRLLFSVSSLHDASQGGVVTYPVFYTKENPLGGAPFHFAPRLILTVVVNDDPDIDGNGVRDVFDFLAFQDLFIAGDLIADFDGNCTLDIFDFLAFQDAFQR
jgi:hypothetical protein